jgi:hypothetical protein
MIQNTKKEWFFEALLQGFKIEKGRVKLGKNLRSIKKNGNSNGRLGFSPGF